MNIENIIGISKTLQLLYVEDDESARKSSLELFSTFFDNITVAVDGQDGLDKFKENNIDIVIADINMPKMLGTQMVHEIKKLDETVSVIFMTAYNEASFLSDGIRLGVDGYLLKPLRPEEMVQVISKICERISLKREHDNYTSNLKSEIKEQTRLLDHKLHFDELTGLCSRYSFFEDISKIDTPIVFIVDINKFKVINEIYGASVGTEVLKEFANFLLTFTRGSTYKVYRISGDEFVLRDETDIIDPDKYEEDIMDFFAEVRNFSVDIENDTVSVEVTMGISTSQHDAFECAKIALEYAKENKKPYEMYSTAIDSRSKEQDALAWKERTKSAITDNRIIPVYQPIVNVDGKIVKYETLMRLKDVKDGKLISPYHFLNVAIKTGLYDTLSSRIIFKALDLIKETNNTLSVNFTYGDIKNMRFLDEIEDFFKANRELGEKTIFEITESESIESYTSMKKFIKRFRRYGVQFAIDDFGSGFSNFEYILEIEPDYLKIDGSLIKNIDTYEKAHILVRAIVQFSHELGIKVIAEYVHSKVIFDMLKELKVDEYQGFYFSEPLETI